MLNIHSIRTVSSLVVYLTFDDYDMTAMMICSSDDESPSVDWLVIILTIRLSLFSLLACAVINIASIALLCMFTHVTVCVCHTEIRGYLLTYLLCSLNKRKFISNRIVIFGLFVTPCNSFVGKMLLCAHIFGRQLDAFVYGTTRPNLHNPTFLSKFYDGEGLRFRFSSAYPNKCLSMWQWGLLPSDCYKQK